MIGQKSYHLGLLLGCLAAFAIGLGYPHAAAADDAATAAEQLTPQQQALIEAAIAASPEVRLAVKLANRGYTADEIDERLSVLTDEEIASLAGEPEMMEAGTGCVLFVLAIAVVAVITALIFVSSGPAEAAN